MKSHKNILKLSDKQIEKFVAIGLCQPKFYKRSAWETASTIMEFMCDNTSIVSRFDYGRGKGKYESNIDGNILQVIKQIRTSYQTLISKL